MRQNRRIKQKMFYSNFGKEIPVYVTDDAGEIAYQTMPDGKTIPRTTGETKQVYEEPAEFYNSISGTLTEDELQAFGGEKRAVAKMTFKKAQYPFRVGTLVWKDSEVGYIGEEVDENSADYRVMGILDEGQHFYRAIMEKVTKGEGR